MPSRQQGVEDEALAEAIADSAKRTIETLKKEVARCTESSAVGKKRLGAKMEFLEAHWQIDHHGLNRLRDLFNAAANQICDHATIS
jgi:hypothetical protein